MRPKLSLVWRYFTEINHESVQCKICLKIYSRKGRGTTSLKTHLRSAHRDAYEQFLQLDSGFQKDNSAANAIHPVLKQQEEKELSSIYESDSHPIAYESFLQVDVKLKEDNWESNARHPFFEKQLDKENIADTNASSDPLPSKHEDPDSQLLTLLCEIDRYNYQYLFERCKECKVNARQLKYLEKDHVRELIPMTNLGTLAEFEYLFNEWKLNNGYNTKFASFGTRTVKRRIPQNGKRALSPQPHKKTARVRADSCKETLIDNEYSAVRTYIDDDDDEESESSASQSSLSASQNKDSSHSKKYLLSQIIPLVLKTCEQKYKSNQGQLTEIDRRMLSSSIVDYFLNRHIQLTAGTIDDLAEQLVECFPTESKRAWYDNRNNKGHGRLHDKFYNSQRRKVKSRHRKKRTDPINPNSPVALADDESMDEEPDEEMVQTQKWLKCNKCEDMDEVINMWRNSITYRMCHLSNVAKSPHSISNILSDWPSYTWPTGNFLLSIDFNHMYPKSEAVFLERWFIFMNKINNLFESELTDNTNMELFIQFKQCRNNLNTDSKEATLIKLLHGITKTSCSFDTPEGSRRYSIVESQSSVMKLIQHVSEISGDEAQTHPCIFVVGDSILKVERCVVAFRGIQYELSFSDAICACFEFYKVFKLEFPSASLNFWNFVSGYFFDIHSENEPMYAVMDNIVKFLETT